MRLSCRALVPQGSGVTLMQAGSKPMAAGVQEQGTSTSHLSGGGSDGRPPAQTAAASLKAG